MRWVARCSNDTFLPRSNDEEAFKLKLPVTIFSAATFKTKKEAEAAVLDAIRAGFVVATNAICEKTYPRGRRVKR